MGFTRTEDKEFGIVTLTPNEDHPWLEDIIIDADPDRKEPGIIISLKADSDEKWDELRALQKLFEKSFRALELEFTSPQLPPLEDRLKNISERVLEDRVEEADEELLKRFMARAADDVQEAHKESVDFSAGPTSKIRSVLNQAGLPPDINEAVLEELQKLWQKTHD